jgi:hypothetical protein
MKKTSYFLKLTIALMFIAFIWGFVDFIKADAKGTFRTLYHPKRQQAVAIVKDTTPRVISPAYFSRGSFDGNFNLDYSNIFQDTEIVVKPKVDSTNQDSIIMAEIMKNMDKSLLKKISLSSFSRGSLDYPIIIKDTTLPAADSVTRIDTAENVL